jgi:AraC-like DNA-binding protein
VFLNYNSRSSIGQSTRALRLIDRDQFGPVMVSRIVAPTAGDVTSSSFLSLRDAIVVGVVLSGAATMGTDAGGFRVSAGELTVFDLDHLTGFAITEDFKAVTLRLGRESLPLSDADLRALERRAIDVRAGVGSVLQATTAQLYRSRGVMSTALKEQLGHALVDLISIVVDETLRRTAAVDDGQSTIVSLALRHIDANLWNSRLSPATIAAEVRVSVRSLHLAFEGEPFTVARTIAVRRLAGARADLERLHEASIGTIATRWGFTSASHFSRAFREAFGASPTQWHRTHHGQLALVESSPTAVPDRVVQAPADRMVANSA